MTRRTGKRFDPASLAGRLAPWIMGVILVGLLITVLVVGLSLAGLTPGQ